MIMIISTRQESPPVKRLLAVTIKINLMVITIVRMMTVVRMMMVTNNQTRGDGEKRSNRDETLHW